MEHAPTPASEERDRDAATTATRAALSRPGPALGAAFNGLRAPGPRRLAAGASIANGDEGEEPRDVEVEPVGQRRARSRAAARPSARRAGAATSAAGRSTTAIAPATSRPSSTPLERRAGRAARAWYCRQSQIENGDSRPSCQPSGAVPEDARRVERVRLEQQDRERGERRGGEAGGERRRRPRPPRRSGIRDPERREQQRARTSSSRRAPTDAPRAHGEVTSQKPQIRNAGRIASFVFELETYCVNGYAAHANASVAARRVPPKRRPTSASPSRQSRSNAIDVACAAGRSSHFPLQPRTRYAGQVGLVGDGPVRVAALVRRLAAAVRLDRARGSRRPRRPGRTALRSSSIGHVPVRRLRRSTIRSAPMTPA